MTRRWKGCDEAQKGCDEGVTRRWRGVMRLWGVWQKGVTRHWGVTEGWDEALEAPEGCDEAAEGGDEALGNVTEGCAEWRGVIWSCLRTAS